MASTTPATKAAIALGAALLLAGGLWWFNRPPSAMALAKRVPRQILEGDVASLCRESAEDDRPWPCGDPQAERRFGAWVRDSFRGATVVAAPTAGLSAGSTFVDGRLLLRRPDGDPSGIDVSVRNLGRPVADQAISAAFSAALGMRCTRREGEIGVEAILRAMEENRASLENMGLKGFPRGGGRVVPWDEEIARQKVRVAMVRARVAKPIGG